MYLGGFITWQGLPRHALLFFEQHVHSMSSSQLLMTHIGEFWVSCSPRKHLSLVILSESVGGTRHL